MTPTNPDEVLTQGAKPKALEMNANASELWLKITKEKGAVLLAEAEQIAKQRTGDSIETGDIQRAKNLLAKKGRFYYWVALVGGALFGAGLRGIMEGFISQKTMSIVVYSITMALGLALCFWAMPRE